MALEQTIWALALAGGRAIPLGILLPGLAGWRLSFRLRVAVGIGLAAFCLPFARGLPLDPYAAPWLLAREIVVGCVLGFVCACVFRAAAAAGGLTDLLRDSRPADAASDGHSPTGLFMLLLATVVFFEIGGVEATVAALARSYQAMPIAGAFPGSRLMRVTIVASAGLIEAAVGFAAPILVAMVLTDVTVAVAARAVPGLPVAALAPPLRSLLGIAVVLLGLAAFEVAVPRVFRGFLSLIGDGLTGGL